MNVGFIGLGHVGGPMSRNVLAAGHDLVVHGGEMFPIKLYEDLTRTPLRLSPPHRSPPPPDPR